MVIRLVQIFIFYLALSHSLAQKVTSTEAIRLGTEINSQAEETSPIWSHKDRKLYFVRALHDNNTGGELAGSDIWCAEFNEYDDLISLTNDLNKWNNHDNNAIIGFRRDDQVVYLLNSYNKNSGIAFSKLKNEKWSSPDVISVPSINVNGSIGFYMSPDYNYLLISMAPESGNGNEDLFVSIKDEKTLNWSTPINLGETINTDGFEISPFMSDDGKLLFFSSNGHDGYGDSDIFVSERLYDGWTVWSKPVNLGSEINSEGFDAFFSTTSTGKSYFASNRGSDSGFTDLFVIDRVQIERLSERERVYLKDTDLNEIIGKKVLEIIFEPNSAELGGEMKELLWFVSQKLSDYENIKLSIIGRIRPNDELSDGDLALQRSLNVHSFLRFAEFSEDKITIDSHLSYLPGSKESTMEVSGVKIRFYYD